MSAPRLPRLVLLWVVVAAGAAAQVPEVQLPVPTGPFGVGRVSLHLVDESRSETMTPNDGTDVRELMVHLFYPADPEAEGQTVRYCDSRNANGLAAYLLPSHDELFQYHLRVRTNSIADLPLAEAPERFPVVLFSPGHGVGDLAYTILHEELASHGFVVASISHAYFSGYTVFPGGLAAATVPIPSGGGLEWLQERLPILNQDDQFVLDVLVSLDDEDPDGRLTGRLDLSRVGAFGHSLGGGNSLEMCRVDPRMDAAVDLDGGTIGELATEGTDRPAMFILTPDRWDAFSTIRDTWSNLRGDGLRVTVAGTRHLSFLDAAWIFTAMLGDEVMAGDEWIMGDIRPEVMVEINRRYLAAFFDHYLRGGPEQALLDLEEVFDGVEVLTRDDERRRPRRPSGRVAPPAQTARSGR